MDYSACLTRNVVDAIIDGRMDDAVYALLQMEDWGIEIVEDEWDYLNKTERESIRIALAEAKGTK